MSALGVLSLACSGTVFVVEIEDDDDDESTAVVGSSSVCVEWRLKLDDELERVEIEYSWRVSRNKWLCE